MECWKTKERWIIEAFFFSVFLHPLRNPGHYNNKSFIGLQLVVMWFIPLTSGRYFYILKGPIYRGGDCLGMSGRESAARILKPLPYTRASSNEFCYPIVKSTFFLVERKKHPPYFLLQRVRPNFGHWFSIFNRVFKLVASPGSRRRLHAQIRAIIGERERERILGIRKFH